ncbi:MAG: hypothetical protein GF307_12120 [candidate division Zixibacteria bacterium]|nr:hypothetical protein [candidate division Zixibacteria bacterium]
MNKLNWFINPLIIIALTSLASVVYADQIESIRAPEPITIDGKFDDWEGKDAHFFEDENMTIAVCNDAENLYIHLRTKEIIWARMIRAAGLKIYLNEKGNRGEEFMLCLKDGPERGQFRGQGFESGKPRMRETSPPPGQFQSVPAFTVRQNENEDEYTILMNGSNGPSAAYDTSLGFYSYELAIPLKDNGLGKYSPGFEPGQTIGFGAVWADIDKEMIRNRMEERSGRGGMRGRPGMRGGMRGRGNQRPEFPEKQEIWLKVKLAEISGK